MHTQQGRKGAVIVVRSRGTSSQTDHSRCARHLAPRYFGLTRPLLPLLPRPLLNHIPHHAPLRNRVLAAQEEARPPRTNCGSKCTVWMGRSQNASDA